jgi:hypothetical protein
MPNEFTAARRGRSARGHGDASRAIRNGVRSQWMSGLGDSYPIDGGIVSRSKASSALISPAVPAASRVCPMLPFTEPMGMAAPAGTRPAITSARAATSVASPSAVDVPCASTRPRSAGSTPARASARIMARTCPSFRGAHRPFPLPSQDEPTPRTIARMGWPCASASSSRSSSSTPTPSEDTNPFARASNGNEPSAESALACANMMIDASCEKETPPARAKSTRPWRRAREAISSAANDDAQAASTTRWRPVRPKAAETSPAIALVTRLTP